MPQRLRPRFDLAPPLIDQGTAPAVVTGRNFAQAESARAADSWPSRWSHQASRSHGDSTSCDLVVAQAVSGNRGSPERELRERELSAELDVWMQQQGDKGVATELQAANRQRVPGNRNR